MGGPAGATMSSGFEGGWIRRKGGRARLTYAGGVDGASCSGRGQRWGQSLLHACGFLGALQTTVGKAKDCRNEQWQ